MGSEDIRIVSKDPQSVSLGCSQSCKLPIRCDGKILFYSSSSLADSFCYGWYDGDGEVYGAL